MKLELKSSVLIKPAQPTWSGFIPLSEFDQIGSLGYVNVVRLYKPPHEWLSPPNDITQVLKSSLAKVLVSFHPLAGRLSPIPGGRYQIDCNGMGAQLTEAESEATLDELTELEHHLLVPSIDVPSAPIHKHPLLAAQLTRFTCGGVCLGVALSHAAADGISASYFSSSWAKVARGEQLEAQPFLDRKLLVDVAKDMSWSAELSRPVEFDEPPLLMGSRQSQKDGKKANLRRARLNLTEIQVDMLKRKANESRGPTDLRFTRYETITAHMWRCACKAWQHSSGQETRLSLSVDLRRRMQPPLPSTYLGNAVLDVVACSYSGDLVSNPLSCAANTIRETINKVNVEYVKATAAYLKSVEDLSCFQESDSGDDQIERAVLNGNPNLCVASWLNLQLQGLDFGWGKEFYMGPVDYGHDGECLIIPGENGSVVVMVCLEEHLVEAFKKIFYEDME